MHAPPATASSMARAMPLPRAWDCWIPGLCARPLTSPARAPTRRRRPPPLALALAPTPALAPLPMPPAKRRRRAAAAAAAASSSSSGGETGVLAGLTVVPYRGGGGAGSGSGGGGGSPPKPGADPQTAAANADHPPHQPPQPDLPFHLWHTDAALMAGCEPCVGPHAENSTPKRVAVLLSGGVDSSVALRLAQAAGHRVEAFYLQIWFEEDFRNTWDACPWEEDLEFARAVAAGPGPSSSAAAAGAPDSNGAAANGSSTTTSSSSDAEEAPPFPAAAAAANAPIIPPVPLTVVPLTRDYWRRVVRESVGEIRRGRTPNPDVLCNSRVKFGAFCEYLERERAGEFDCVASGHYARLLRAGDAGGGQGEEEEEEGEGDETAAGAAAATSRWAVRAGALPGEAVLALTPDAVKDQTYFLAALSRAQVARAMFPIAALPKARVRALAASAALPTSARPDSQGICFLGKVRFPEFVREHLGAWPGLLVAVDDDDDGGEGEEDGGAGAGRRRRSTVVGGHEGYWFFTVGQRAGIRLPGGPWYVSRKDPRLNVVEVSRSRPAAGEQAQEGGEEEVGAGAARPAAAPSTSSSFFCGPINWLTGARPRFSHGGTGVGDDEDLPPLLVKVRHGPNTHAVAAFEVVVCGGGVGAAAGAGAGSEEKQQQHHHQSLSAAERALAEAELSALAAADEAAAADEERQQVAGEDEAAAAAAGRAPSAAADRAPASASASASAPPIGDPPPASFARVRLAGRDQGLAAGQYAVFYQGGVCLGSAKMLAAR